MVKQKGFNWKKLVKNPLLIGIVVALISIIITHHYDLRTIEYEKSLEETLVVDFLGQHEFIAKPNENYRFDGVLIYNPSAKSISVKEIKMYAPVVWFEQTTDQPQQKPEVNLPKLPEIGSKQQTEFQPYMEIQSGKIEQMKGMFFLETPSKEDDYYLSFCAITYDNKQFCAKDSLVIHIRINQTLS